MKKNKNKRTLASYGLGGKIGDPNKPAVYNSQQEIDQANALAKRLAVKNGLDPYLAENSYVAKNVGDPQVQFVDQKTNLPLKKFPNSIPLDVKDIQSENGQYWYTDPHTGDLTYVDPSVTNQPRFKKKMANGGIATKLGAQFPGIANSIIDILDNNHSYSNQPLVNTSALRTMSDPYAYGGTAGMSEEQLASLQQMADEQGMDLDSFIQMLNDGSYGEQTDSMDADQGVSNNEDAGSGDEYETDEEEGFGYGGTIHIKASNRGKFNATKKRTGKTTSQLTHSTNPMTRKRAIFAQNAAKWNHHAYGGVANANINAEGNEVIETPNGQVGQIKGPSHENGGVDMSVPEGTKVFSNRIKIDGLTMQERKLKRERQLKKIHNAIASNPSNNLAKNTLKRTLKVHDDEESMDMGIQNAVSHAAKVSALKKKYGFGTSINGVDDGEEEFKPWLGLNPMTNVSRTSITDQTKAAGFTKSDDGPGEFSGALSAGDMIGMAGNAFNAIAPIINTNSARRATMPNINRFRGFGRDAIAANDKSQDLLENGSLYNEIDTDANTAYEQNRNSAGSINTLRALNAGTDLSKMRAKVSAKNSFSKLMSETLSQRAQISMMKDRAEMTGQSQTDTENKYDTDNYYSNMAENLVNAGNNVQGIGRAFNQRKSNVMDAKLLSQLSRYGLGIDDYGNLISTKKGG